MYIDFNFSSAWLVYLLTDLNSDKKKVALLQTLTVHLFSNHSHTLLTTMD